uniref:Connector Protein n=1 Tax=Ribes TaxID=3801 RepID=UPI0023BB1BBE|nr:Chain E, Connector Protein [Ribes]8CK1_F Chain F, Connector Protein [Ribes]
MPSKVDICNRALSNTGTDITIASLTEKSKEARLCQQWYDATLASLLRTYQWAFAQRRVTLALIGVGPAGWRHKYRYPTDAITIHDVFTADTYPDGASEFTDGRYRQIFQIASDGEGGRLVLANCEDAMCRYTSDIEDPNLMPPDFSTALEMMLAKNIAMPMTGNPGLMTVLAQQAASLVSDAIARDQNEGYRNPLPYASWTRANIGDSYPDDDHLPHRGGRR